MTHLTSLRQLAADHWPGLRQRALPTLKLVLARPWLPAAVAASLLSFLLIPLHNRLHLPSRWPDSMMLLVADVWLYAGVATLAIVLSRRLSPRPVMPGAGLLAGYAMGLLALVAHGLSLSSPGLHWLSLWSSYAALRHATAFLVGLAAGEAAVWAPRLLAHPPATPTALKPSLDLFRPYAKLLQGVGIVLAWLTPALLTVGLDTHFRALPVKPWAHPSQAPGYWLALLLAPTLFALWTIQQRARGRQVAGGALFAFVGVQWGLLGALIIWPYPSWQRETAVACSAFLGLIGVGLALVTIPQPSDIVSRRVHKATALALAAIGVALGTVVVGFAVSPALQAMVWRQAALTMNLPRYAVARLAAVHGSDAVPALVATLGEAHPEVAEAAAKALLRLDPPTVRALAAMLPRATLRQRCWAAYFLGESKQREAVAPLLAVLRDELPPPAPDRELQEREALAVSSWPPNPLAAEAQRRQERELARYHNPPVRRTGLPPKYMCYTYSPEILRAVAVNALAKIGDPAVGPALAAVLDDASLSVRRSALLALATVQYRPAVPALRATLQSGGAAERALAAEALTAMGDREIVLPLIKLLESGDSREVTAAARGLMQIGDKRAIKPLGEALARGSDSSGLELLLKAYQSLGGDTLQPLLAATDNPEPWVWGFAASKLGDQHPAEGVAHFAKLLTDPQRAEHAALILRGMATEEARAALRAHGWPEDWQRTPHKVGCAYGRTGTEAEHDGM